MNRKSFPKGIEVTNDHTPAQRALYTKLKQEATKLNRLNPQEPKVVKYVNGTPQLVEARPQPAASQPESSAAAPDGSGDRPHLDTSNINFRPRCR